LNRKFITQWSTVLAIVFEWRTGRECGFDGPFAFEVLGTDALGFLVRSDRVLQAFERDHPWPQHDVRAHRREGNLELSDSPRSPELSVSSETWLW
jgi:hypothetical protein